MQFTYSGNPGVSPRRGNVRRRSAVPYATALNSGLAQPNIVDTALLLDQKKGLMMKILPIVAAMIFGVAGVANAQGYDSDKGDPMTEQQRRDSSQQGTGSSNTSGYGGSGSQQGDSSRKSSSSQYGGSYQSGVDVDLYDQDAANGTGPRIKGRY